MRRRLFLLVALGSLVSAGTALAIRAPDIKATKVRAAACCDQCPQGTCPCPDCPDCPDCCGGCATKVK
jgi:hypothetical protein